MTETKKKRVAVYIDGYNLYHSVKKVDKKSVWLDLTKIVDIYTHEQHHDIKAIYYFSAQADWDNEFSKQHKKYLEKLHKKGVKIILGNFIEERCVCPKCHLQWIEHTEKQSDVNLCVQLIKDSVDNVFDIAFVVSADSDLLPAIKFVKQKYQKSIKIIAPPNTKTHKTTASIIGKNNIKQLSSDNLSIL